MDRVSKPSVARSVALTLYRRVVGVAHHQMAVQPLPPALFRENNGDVPIVCIRANTSRSVRAEDSYVQRLGFALLDPSIRFLQCSEVREM
jgi:hypothetical protein